MAAVALRGGGVTEAMSALHDELARHGREQLSLWAPDAERRRQVDAAAEILSHTSLDPAWTHPGLCLTVLPHRDRGRAPNEAWIRRGPVASLAIQPIVDGTGRYLGVPYGPRARLILLYLQAEAIKTRSRMVELGGSLHAWMRAMGMGTSGWDYEAVREQARRIDRSLLTFEYRLGDEEFRVQDTITRSSQGNSLTSELIVELSEGYYQALSERPVPVAEQAVRTLRARCTALDVYLWLSYRLHALEAPTKISWRSLFSQFGAEIAAPKHFKSRFGRDFEMALAVYPAARARLTENGAILEPSDPPLPPHSRQLGLLG